MNISNPELGEKKPWQSKVLIAMIVLMLVVLVPTFIIQVMGLIASTEMSDGMFINAVGTVGLLIVFAIIVTLVLLIVGIIRGMRWPLIVFTCFYSLFFLFTLLVALVAPLTDDSSGPLSQLAFVSIIFGFPIYLSVASIRHPFFNKITRPE